MRIAIFGGSFDPPHIGHFEAAEFAASALNADKLMVIPAPRPPHKAKCEASPDEFARFQLAELAFKNLPRTEVLDLELKRQGPSYTIDTLRELRRAYPTDELVLLMGTDMLLYFQQWKDYQGIFDLATLGVFPRRQGEDSEIASESQRLISKFGAKIIKIGFTPTDISSTRLREMLQNRQGLEFFDAAVYAKIIRNRYYGAKPNFAWLRGWSYAHLNEKRIPHVAGCEQEAMRLAEKWGANVEDAAEAAILHDITKNQKDQQQLNLCEKYGIITDVDERSNAKLLHAKTGAALSRKLFGISDEVYSAIWWHTTGRASMTLLEKIIYMADYIEPSRHFEGVEELRRLAYINLDSALILGFEMGLEDLQKRELTPHFNSSQALNWLKTHKTDDF